MLAVCKFRGVAFSGVKAVPCAIGAGRPGAAALVCGQFGQKSNVKYEYSACPLVTGPLPVYVGQCGERVRGTIALERCVCMFV